MDRILLTTITLWQNLVHFHWSIFTLANWKIDHGLIDQDHGLKMDLFYLFIQYCAVLKEIFLQ